MLRGLKDENCPLIFLEMRWFNFESLYSLLRLFLFDFIQQKNEKRFLTNHKYFENCTYTSFFRPLTSAMLSITVLPDRKGIQIL
jgi:hypothetical protein